VDRCWTNQKNDWCAVNEMNGEKGEIEGRKKKKQKSEEKSEERKKIKHRTSS